MTYIKMLTIKQQLKKHLLQNSNLTTDQITSKINCYYDLLKKSYKHTTDTNTGIETIKLLTDQIISNLLFHNDIGYINSYHYTNNIIQMLELSFINCMWCENKLSYPLFTDIVKIVAITMLYNNENCYLIKE